MTTLPGYVTLLKDAEDVVGKLAEQLGYAGIHATLSSDGESCVLSVPREQEAKARALLAEYFTASSRERKDEDLENFQESFLRKTPTFMSSEEKVRSRSQSVWIFLGISAFVLITGTLRLIRGDVPQGIYYLVFGVLFLVFGLITLDRVRRLKRSAEEEKAFTEKVTEWFSETYTAAGIDKMILSSAPSDDPAEMDVQRLACIRDYIRREFDLQDAAYLEYLTEKIFRAFYE